MQTDRKPLQVHLCYTTIQNQQRPKASLSFPRSCLAYVWVYETDKQIYRQAILVNISFQQVTSSTRLLEIWSSCIQDVFEKDMWGFLFCSVHVYMGVSEWCRGNWGCCAALCCQIKCVSAAGWNDVHMCMSVCLMRKYNRHVRAVNAQQTDILRSQCTAFCEGYLENTGRVQMRLISTGRSYQTRL